MNSKFFSWLLVLIIGVVFFKRLDDLGPEIVFKHWNLLFSNLFLTFLFYLPFASSLYFFWKKIRFSDAVSVNKTKFFVLPITVAGIAFIAHVLSLIGWFSMWVVLTLWILFWIPIILNRGKILTYSFFWLIENLKKPLFLSLVLILILIFIDIWFAISGTGSLYPPMACDHSLMHLVLPKAIAYSGVLDACWWVRAPWHPLLVHHLYAALISFAQSLSARWDIITGLNNFFLVITVISIAMSVFNVNMAILFGIIFISFPVVQNALQISYLDIGLTIWVLGVSFSVLNYLKSKNQDYIYLSIFFSLIAFSTKHMGAFYVIPQLVTLIVFDFFYGGKQIWKIKNILSYVVLVGVIFGVIFGRNFFYTGNPLFPFGIAKEPNFYFWDKMSTVGINQAITHWKGNGTFSDFGNALLSVITEPSALSDTGPYWVGPLAAIILVLGLLIAFLYKQQTKIYLILLSWLFVIILFWFFTSPVVRYLIPVLALISLFFCWIMANTKKSVPIYGYVFIALVIIIGIAESNKTINRGHVMSPPVTRVEKDSFIRKNFLASEAIEYIKSHSDESDVTYSFLDECNKLYYTVATVGDWFGGAGYHLILRRNPIELKSFFSSLRIKYLVTNPLLVESTSWDIAKGDTPVKRLFGDYGRCFLKTSLNDERMLLYEINQKDDFCYDKNIPVHPGYDELIKRYPRF